MQLPNTISSVILVHVSSSSVYKMDEDDAPIKRCPKCKVYIERDEGCAQMMCKNCKHAFCWYCLESLDVSLLYRLYNSIEDEDAGIQIIPVMGSKCQLVSGYVAISMVPG